MKFEPTRQRYSKDFMVNVIVDSIRSGKGVKLISQNHGISIDTICRWSSNFLQSEFATDIDKVSTKTLKARISESLQGFWSLADKKNVIKYCIDEGKTINEAVERFRLNDRLVANWVAQARREKGLKSNLLTQAHEKRKAAKKYWVPNVTSSTTIMEKAGVTRKTALAWIEYWKSGQNSTEEKTGLQVNKATKSSPQLCNPFDMSLVDLDLRPTASDTQEIKFKKAAKVYQISEFSLKGVADGFNLKYPIFLKYWYSLDKDFRDLKSSRIQEVFNKAKNNWVHGVTSPATIAREYGVSKRCAHNWISQWSKEAGLPEPDYTAVRGKLIREGQEIAARQKN